MYQASYLEVAADSPADARANERRALDHACTLLLAAQEAGPSSPAAGAALSFVSDLWAIFIGDLADPGNELPDDLKARLMSIGLWVMREADRIAVGDSNDFVGVAEICGMIRDGLH